MRYDPAHPVAVFLGPSLDRASAEAVLAANYYPPARMGDVYRLLATGVELIAIVDGVFHETTPVWQREIVAALRCGITVVGASSMGALRAAELWPLGMIGRGRIFELFRSGALDGDDEVALLHADSSLAWRPLSLPLVNLRHDLSRAEAAGLVDAATASAMVDHLKRLHFRERRLELLGACPALERLAPPRRERLLGFLQSEGEDLKRLDALEALRYCARLRAGEEATPAPSERPSEAPPSTFPAIEALRRGLPRVDGTLVTAEEALGRIPPEEWTRRLPGLHARFYLERFLEAARGTPPPGAPAELRSRLGSRPAEWLRRVGLTPPELDAALASRAAVEWLLAADPESLGVAFAAQRRCAAALAAWLARRSPEAPSAAELTREAAESAYAVAWARQAGIEGPGSAEVEAFAAGWEQRQGVGSRTALLRELGLEETEYLEVFGERAFFHWLVERGPAHFGWSGWSAPLALLRELQLEDALAPLLEEGSR